MRHLFTKSQQTRIAEQQIKVYPQRSVSSGELTGKYNVAILNYPGSAFGHIVGTYDTEETALAVLSTVRATLLITATLEQ